MTSTTSSRAHLPTVEERGVTHAVTNQPAGLSDYNAADDVALLEGLRREGAGWYEEDLVRLGALAGSSQVALWRTQANRNTPELKAHDALGHRIDEVEFHPSWHQLLEAGVGAGVAGAAWADPRPGSHVARAAAAAVWSHAEAGHGCPMAMTYAVIPALRHAPHLAATYEPLLTSRIYEPGLRVPSEKQGLLAGMGMTEKQGGSDVRSNTTTATRTSEDGVFSLRGHKWFTSAPMSDLFLVLAQAPGGLSCFMVPRVLPDGARNVFRIQRLKDKLGNRSNASAEPEFDGTLAWLVGDEGRGVRTILEMVNATRLDCVGGSVALMRQALLQAVNHASKRRAFNDFLIDKSLMQNVLADLALESEAATVLLMRLAGAADRAIRGDAGERALGRICTAAAKYWVPKRTPMFVAEAMECLGGNGYVEDSGLPRLYREAPLNSIWEGAGNVNALDVLRAAERESTTIEALVAELGLGRGADSRLDTAIAALTVQLRSGHGEEGDARRLVERIALTLQGSLLVRHSSPEVADAFCATRLGADYGHVFGTLPSSVDTRAVLARATTDAA